MGRKVRFAPQAARKLDIPDGPLRANSGLTHRSKEHPIRSALTIVMGVKDARTATIEPNEIDNMPLRAR